VYWIPLYMFRTVSPSIIRSPRLYIERQVYVIQDSWLLASGHVPASKQSTNLYDIYLMLCVQSGTPDDGRRDCPKHVEWYSLNSKNCASSWFYYRNTRTSLLKLSLIKQKMHSKRNCKQIKPRKQVPYLRSVQNLPVCLECKDYNVHKDRQKD